MSEFGDDQKEDGATDTEFSVDQYRGQPSRCTDLLSQNNK
jgi:hypothetical protein